MHQSKHIIHQPLRQKSTTSPLEAWGLSLVVDNEMHIQSVIEFALIKEEPNVERTKLRLKLNEELEAWKKDSRIQCILQNSNHKLINRQLY